MIELQEQKVLDADLDARLTWAKQMAMKSPELCEKSLCLPGLCVCADGRQRGAEVVVVAKGAAAKK